MDPDTLTSLNSSASWHGILVFKYNATQSNTVKTVYSLHNGTAFLGNQHNIKVTHSTNTWSDDGNDIPDDPLVVNGSNIECWNASTLQYVFAKPTVADWISSGPTVTSITATKIFVPSDTVSNTDFTLLKNGSAYANTNISLTGPALQPPSDTRGYTYSLTYNGTGYYQRGIDSKSISEFFYDASWTSSPSSGKTLNSNRILNVLASIPADTHIQSSFGVDLLTYHQTRYMRHTVPLYENNVHTENVHIDFEVTNETINGTDEIVGKFHMEHASAAVNALTNTPTVYSISSSNAYIIGDQEFMTTSFTYNGDIVGYKVVDWVYSDEPEDDGYIAPVTTTSNGGGKPDRYPLIMTNLFNRNRSLYSIGMTHKDTWDLFL